MRTSFALTVCAVATFVALSCSSSDEGDGFISANDHKFTLWNHSQTVVERAWLHTTPDPGDTTTPFDEYNTYTYFAGDLPEEWDSDDWEQIEGFAVSDLEIGESYQAHTPRPMYLSVERTAVENGESRIMTTAKALDLASGSTVEVLDFSFRVLPASHPDNPFSDYGSEGVGGAGGGGGSGP